MVKPRAEAARDQSENAFTPILRRLFSAVPALVATVLVDVEGECIDYVGSIDPYDAKVSAAHMHMVLQRLRAAQERANAGETYAFEIVAAQREVWGRGLGEDYVLIAILAHGFDRSELHDAMLQAGREFRDEVGISTRPRVDGRDHLSVRLRTSSNWHYAPEGYSFRGERVAISDVLGRWIEQPAEGEPPIVCFRVRTRQGQEVTLAHDERTEAWQLRE